MQCAPIALQIVDSTKRRFYLAVESRRAITKAGRAVKRSALQTVQDIMSAWGSEDGTKMTSTRLFELCSQQLGDIDDKPENEEIADASLSMTK